MRQETTIQAAVTPLQVVPCSTEACVDPYSLEGTKQPFCQLFFNQLLAGDSIRLNFQTNSAQEAALMKLNHLSQNAKGCIIGFGYPMLLRGNLKEPGWIASPLFVWEAQFVRKEIGEWVLKTNGDSCAMLNTELFEHLEHLDRRNYRRNINQFLIKDKPKASQLLEWTKELASNWNLPDSTEEWRLNKAFTLADMEAFSTQNGLLHQSGIFAVFEEKNCLAVNTLEVLPKTEDTEVIVESKAENSTHSYTAFSLTASQQLVFDSIRKHRDLTIKGMEGSEQVELISALLTNLLANQKHGILILENAELAKKIRSSLQKIGLHHLCLDMTDELSSYHDLHQIIKPVDKKINYDENQFQVWLRSCTHWLEEFGKEKAALEEKVDEEYTWRDLLAEHLSNQENGDGELLAPLLNPRNFEFAHAELAKISIALGASKSLYQPLFVLNHPLDDLHPDIFIEKYYEEAVDFCQQQIKKHKKALIQQIHDLIKGQEAYRWKLKTHYESFYQQAERQSQKLAHFVANLLKQYGAEFTEIGVFGNAKLKLQGVFSEKKKSLLKTRREVAALYEKIALEHKTFQAFPFAFPKPSTAFDFGQISGVLSEYREALSTWRSKFPQLIEKETTNLKSSDSLERHGDFLELPKLEAAFEDVLYQLNAAKLFSVQFEGKEVFYHEKINYLQTVVNYLEKADHALRDFPDFFEWKKRWYTLDTLNKEVLSAIITARPANWLKAFQQWYWQEAVKRHAQDELPDQKSALDEYGASHEKLLLQMPGHIATKWGARRKTVLQTYKKEQKDRYEQLASLLKVALEGMHLTQRVLPLEFDLLHAYYPIWLLSADHFSYVFPDSAKGAFDLAILDHSLLQGQEITQANAQAIFKQDTVENSYPIANTSAAQLIEAIARRLGKQIDSKRIQTNVPLLKDFMADILITPLEKDSTPILIQCDGIADGINEGMAHSLKIIRDSDVHYIETWSRDWWKDAEKEGKRLVELVEGFDRGGVMFNC